MAFELWQYAAVFLLIALAGLIDSIAGGGGLISVPTYLAMGLPAEFVLGTNKCVSSTGTTLAVGRYIAGRAILWRTVIYAIVAALLGSALGARLSTHLSRELMVALLLVVIPLIFLLQARQGRAPAGERPEQRQTAARAAAIGLLIGGYDGLFGPGTGAFILLAFMAFLGMSAREASANARIVNYASNLSAFAYFLLQGRIFWPVAAVAIAGSLCGNWLGSGLVIRNAESIVVPAFRLVLLLLLAKCGYDLYCSGLLL